MKKLTIFLIRIYQIISSPILGHRCRFYPTCSQYGVKSIKKFGFLKGTWITLIRVLKCHPVNFK